MPGTTIITRSCNEYWYILLKYYEYLNTCSFRDIQFGIVLKVFSSFILIFFSFVFQNLTMCCFQLLFENIRSDKERSTFEIPHLYFFRFLMVSFFTTEYSAGYSTHSRRDLFLFLKVSITLIICYQYKSRKIHFPVKSCQNESFKLTLFKSYQNSCRAELLILNFKRPNFTDWVAMLQCCQYHYLPDTVHCKTELLPVYSPDYTTNRRILAHLYHTGQTDWCRV